MLRTKPDAHGLQRPPARSARRRSQRSARVAKRRSRSRALKCALVFSRARRLCACRRGRRHQTGLRSRRAARSVTICLDAALEQDAPQLGAALQAHPLKADRRSRCSSSSIDVDEPLRSSPQGGGVVRHHDPANTRRRAPRARRFASSSRDAICVASRASAPMASSRFAISAGTIAATSSRSSGGQKAASPTRSGGRRTPRCSCGGSAIQGPAACAFHAATRRVLCTASARTLGDLTSRALRRPPTTSRSPRHARH